ncbi:MULTISPECIES: hypothetical protein [unclassified Streptomyces]|uniref:hypothetical protein n=1 Tax=unclassified Streptomyces TaxID=2593676 RepID=UPI0016603C0E|nr:MULTISPECIES: hypothetical protein [unclassified Streptomyces]MBD0711064.1 hypothetical protein [Streptomyces sp. CBMA291]MBD0712523.1 hypothetical protein [Streptomyces sp. CBMA370]
MARRPIALVTALVLLLEAPGVVAVNAVMARFVKAQSMSLGGLDPAATHTGTWALGIASGAALALCALVALVAGIRDRRPGRLGRTLLVGCALAHGLLGALAVALLGWGVFAFLVGVLGLIVLTLVAYGKEAEESESEEERGAASAAA